MEVSLHRIARRLLHRAGGTALVLMVTFGSPAPGSAAFASPRDRGSETRLARCIARASESRPWLEKTLWALRDQEGGWAGAEIANKDGSHDLGPLQVNSWWIPRLAKITGRPAPRVRHWLKNDVCFNVDAARWIFLSGLAATGDYWKAIGVYHSPARWRQRRYARSVAAHLGRRYGPAAFGAGSGVRAKGRNGL